MHLGQSTRSQPLSGHLISHTGGSHCTSQLANLGVEQLGVHRGGSQIGSQTAKLLLNFIIQIVLIFHFNKEVLKEKIIIFF